uniref:protein NRT1/ PTR FAMILY 5.9-like n=1 Tax=Erigeron canadensis TaxID=72917 RepID=UPI001CB8BE65|nr:protein NRT1/ PTR FAMILY 5.9-like [Erigeron canadensis]
MLLLMFNPYGVKWLVVIILVLLALGTSGDQLLQEVLIDLVNNDIDKSQDNETKERSIARATIWSRIAKVAAAICTILWVAPGNAVGGVHSSWGSSFLICIVTMTICLIIFCIGHSSYHQGQLTETPVGVFFRVLHMRIKKLLERHFLARHINDSSRLDGSLHNLGKENKGGDEGIMGKRSPLPTVDSKGQEANGCSCSYNDQDDIVVVKSLLRMFPMWGMFLVVSLISATGSTFFLQQYNNLNTNNQVAVQIYDLIKDVSSFAIPFLYCWICGLRKNNEKVKIGIGMLCGIVSCVFAWQLEVQRLKKVSNLDDKDANTSLSFLWLVPQFCVLGGMEGLTWEGLLNFYKSQMKEETLQSYGEEYSEFVMCFGKFLNIILIIILKSQPAGWFGDTINDSRLDKYYLLLVSFCLANFIIYCLIARYYYKDPEGHQDSVNDDLNPGASSVNYFYDFLECLQNC